jgi:hypothetical protein
VLFNLKQNLAMEAFCDRAPCSMVVVRAASIVRAIYRCDNGGSKHLWNVGLLQRDYTTLYPRKI